MCIAGGGAIGVGLVNASTVRYTVLYCNLLFRLFVQ
jgi:hypothetical protein